MIITGGSENAGYDAMLGSGMGLVELIARGCAPGAGRARPLRAWIRDLPRRRCSRRRLG